MKKLHEWHLVVSSTQSTTKVVYEEPRLKIVYNLLQLKKTDDCVVQNGDLSSRAMIYAQRYRIETLQ
jgi:hypothetical protein